MILEDIKNKLLEIDSNVYYGMFDTRIKTSVWDFIVFNRASLKLSTNKTGHSEYYTVTIIRENFIPEGVEIEVINKMLELTGMKLASSDGIYSYLMKPNTDIVIEMFTISFVRAKKV